MIPKEEWLSAAKALPIGMRSRVFHRREGRPNLVVGNDPDKWWCYCHACHEGGMLDKEHVLLGAVAPNDSNLLALPSDLINVIGTEFEIPIARFLATKNMDFKYLPECYYSASRKRLYLREGPHWFGRDLTGASKSKWLNYDDVRLVGQSSKHTVVVEDMFSRYKVQWAMREHSGVSCICNLGTGVNRAITQLALKDCESLIWFFDADTAGDAGARGNIRQNKVLGIRQSRVRPPEGLDPKDMHCDDIIAALTKEL